MTACSADLDQSPPNFASADSLTDFEGVLNAAYYYQLASVTPLAVMAEFRSDNALMEEAPYTEFDTFTSNLTTMEDQFFGPLYTALYKSILSANNVCDNIVFCYAMMVICKRFLCEWWINNNAIEYAANLRQMQDMDFI